MVLSRPWLVCFSSRKILCPGSVWLAVPEPRLAKMCLEFLDSFHLYHLMKSLGRAQRKSHDHLPRAQVQPGHFHSNLRLKKHPHPKDFPPPPARGHGTGREDIPAGTSDWPSSHSEGEKALSSAETQPMLLFRPQVGRTPNPQAC